MNYLMWREIKKKSYFIFFIVAPCILIYVDFTHQQMHFFIFKNIKIYIKIHINIAPTCFVLRPFIRELALNLVKVIFMLNIL